MAPYDSDSSDGEEKDYTETNVLLGYASKEPSDDMISHLGGHPTWLDPLAPPSATLAKCKVCNDLMVLLLQLNGDLPAVFPGHERRLYVLTCRRKTCRRKEGSVKVLRGVRISEIAPPKSKEGKTTDIKKEDAAVPKPVISIGEQLFGAKPSSNPASANPFSTSSSVNPFSTSSSKNPPNPFVALGLPAPSNLVAKIPQNPSTSPSDAANLPKTFAAALAFNNDKSKTFGPLPPSQHWPQESDLPPAYPTYYLADADYEILDKEEDIPIPTQTMDLDDNNGASGKEDKDVYESSLDKTFQKFADRLAQNPEQVIRYEFKGAPLLYSNNDAVGQLLGGSGNKKVKSAKGMPRCGNCGGERVFEVQLTPHAILELEREDNSIDGMEWGTIIVAVCERDCQELGVEKDGKGTGYLEEWAGVQWEELSERR